MPAAVAAVTALAMGGSYMEGRQKEKGIHQGFDMLQAGQAKGRADVNEWYGKAAGEFDPWLKTGKSAENIIADLSGANGPEAQAMAYERFKTDPAYKFRVDQANKGYERSAMARGNLFSGNFAAGLADLNQGLASQGYGDYYERLLGLSKTGYNAAGSRANLFAQEGTTLGNIAVGQGTQMANLAVQEGANRGNMYKEMFAAPARGIGMAYGMGGGASGAGGSMYQGAGSIIKPGQAGSLKGGSGMSDYE